MPIHFQTPTGIEPTVVDDDDDEIMPDEMIVHNVYYISVDCSVSEQR